MPTVGALPSVTRASEDDGGIGLRKVVAENVPQRRVRLDPVGKLVSPRTHTSTQKRTRMADTRYLMADTRQLQRVSQSGMIQYTLRVNMPGVCRRFGFLLCSVLFFSGSVRSELVQAVLTFILDEHTNLYAFEKFGVPLMQYNIIRGSGKMPGIKQMIVSSDLFQKLVDIVSTPSEKVHEVSPVKARRQRRQFIDSILQEAPYLQRIMLAIDAAGVLLAVAILDVWNRTNVPRHRGPPSIDLIDIARKDETALMTTSLSEKFNGISTNTKAEKFRS